MRDHGVDDVVTALLLAVDELDWTGVRAALADEVRLDYTDLFGGEVETVPGDEVVRRWQGLLPGFDATQHLTGPLLVAEGAGGDTTVRTAVRGYHRFTEGGEHATWMVAGRYDMRVRRTPRGPRVTAVTLTVSYQDGDPKLTELAARRVAEGAGGRVGS
ncbi:SnoaL-like protein [Prauserella shujinwangii]|uniref:SnoaL-like protein n=1 Tax=Prauserella shujinwangii TaxID=1453103 RepID=A0A2T0LYE8_9PSEU|nr:nuclear transport factor 2 family protein [Prauserella shujinwangii]PRX49134.1 SnoaL-like protein [Prauserella shujinwangii]